MKRIGVHYGVHYQLKTARTNHDHGIYRLIGMLLVIVLKESKLSKHSITAFYSKQSVWTHLLLESFYILLWLKLATLSRESNLQKQVDLHVDIMANLRLTTILLLCLVLLRVNGESIDQYVH